ncbi:transporter, partial [Haemophilus influenzae HK1212]
VSLVTNDIELLEVFYAHTIAPIMIAFFTSAILLLVFAHLSGWFVLVALAAYLTVGVILPIITTKLAREDGRRYRELVKRSAQRGIPVPATATKPNTDKMLRIESLQPHMVNGLI